MDIEILAVNEISGLVAECRHLQSFIATNDKTPFTDGHIDLYDDISRAKAGWVGRVDVQVKGRRTNSRGKFSEFFPIPRDELRAFQQQGGVVFFAVFIDPKSGRKYPLYRVLSPFGIRDILDAHPEGRKKIPVELNPLPRESDAIERIMYVALKSQDQRISVGFDVSLIEGSTSITLYSTDRPDFDAPVSLNSATGDAVFVLNTAQGMSLPMPGELMIFPPSYLPREIEAPIRAGDATFNRPVVRQIGDRSFEMKLSEGLSITTHGEARAQSSTVSLTPTDNLLERIKDIEFYLGLTTERALEIGGKRSPFEFADDPDDAPLGEHLQALRKLQTLFEALRIDANLIRLSEITSEQLRTLLHMHHSLVDGQELSAVKGSSGFIYAEVAQWQIALLVLPGTSPSTWTYADAFAPEHQHRYRVHRKAAGGGIEPCSATVYDVIEVDALPDVLNLRLSEIAAPYQAIADLPETSTLANMRVLGLLKAADKRAERRLEFLTAAGTLNEWLISDEGEQAHHLINRWQIMHRSGTLTAIERSSIREFRRSVLRDPPPRADEIDLLCAILLGDEDDISDAVHRLPESEMSRIKDYPIWALVPVEAPPAADVAA